MLARDAIESTTSHWWTWLIRGIIAILFGIVIVMNPGVSILVFILFFAGFAFADGIFALVAAFRTSENRIWLIIEGIAGIGLGLLAFFHPFATVATLAIFMAYLIAAWALVTGIMEVIMAWRLREQIKNEWFLIIVGLLSIVLGIYLFFFPGVALIAWIWYVAIYAFIAGVGFIAFAFRLKGLHDKVSTAAA
jgi:uncharacterized membrane protein HdeD (DUF308 family)